MTDIDDIDRPTKAAKRPGAGVAHSNRLPAGHEREKAAEVAAPTSLTAVQLALYAGWTMAVLYAAAPVHPAEGPPELPTVHELPEPERRAVEVGRLRRLVGCLTEMPGSFGLVASAAPISADDPDFSGRLSDLHLTLLGALAAAGLEMELAYQLGRSLRDTVDPRMGTGQHESSPDEAVARQLARGRVAQLQEWLATLSPEFPPQVAAIVGASMGKWSDFAEVTVGPSSAKQQKIADKAKFAGHMRDYLLQQGDVWLMLLVGVRSTDGLLTPEGYVSAGEAALRRSARIVRGVLAHYWAAALCLGAALGGVLYLAVAHLAGGGQVWTSIAAIGSTMGISAQSIRSAISRLCTEAERPVLTAAEEDVKAWAITTLPPANLTVRGTRKLRKSGIAKPVGLGRF